MKTIKTLTDGTIHLTAPVMIPGAHDCDYENGEPPLTTEQIRRFAQSYEKYRFIDHEHGLTRNGERIGEPVDSFLLTEDTTMTTLDGSMKSYPRGSWFVTSHITQPEAIETALGGGYTGYSASVFTRSRADEYLTALKSEPDTPMPCSCKDVSSSGNSLIRDVPDPVVLSVSLVKSPCLHDSQFCEVNGDIMENQEDVKSLKSKVLSAMGMSEEAEVVALKSEVEDLKATITTLQTDFQTALKSMQDEFTKTLTEALHPVESEALKAKEEDEDEDEADKAKEEEKEEETDETAEEEAEEETKEEEEKEDETAEEEVAEEEETEEDEEEEEEEKKAEKGESKQAPVHDNLQAQKSTTNIYEALGRNPDGTRKK